MIANQDDPEVPVTGVGSYEWAVDYSADAILSDDCDVSYRRVGVRRRGWPNPHTLIPYSIRVPPENLCQEDREALDWYPIYEA